MYKNEYTQNVSNKLKKMTTKAQKNKFTPLKNNFFPPPMDNPNLFGGCSNCPCDNQKLKIGSGKLNGYSHYKKNSNMSLGCGKMRGGSIFHYIIDIVSKKENKQK